MPVKHYHLPDSQLREIQQLIEAHYNELRSAGQEHFGM